MTTQMRHCWFCGAELGVYSDRDYDDMDTCGARECERAARDEIRREREEEHQRLDRDLGR